MRQTIRLEVGVGWQLRGREVGGVEKTQVTYQYPDGLGKKNPRSSVFLPYDWSSRNQSKITRAVVELKRLIDSRNLIIKEVEKFRLGPSEEGSAVTDINLGSIADEFTKSRSGTRLKTKRSQDQNG